MNLNSVAVIIVNWNRKDDLVRCVRSVQLSEGADVTVFVVDNASSDGSCDAVEALDGSIVILRNFQNLGFAEGNNVALRIALTEGYPYVMLLNNDATVEPDTIALMLQPLLDDPQVGVTSGAVCYMDAPSTVWSAGGRIDRQRGIVTSQFLNANLSELPTEPYEVDHVTGCAMLVRSEAIARAGLLDSRFFMYYEETEWCARIARNGYRLMVVPQARVLHAISPEAQVASPAIAYYMTRNHLLFLRATRAPLGAWVYTVGQQVRTLASLFLTRATPARKRGRVPMLRAMRDFALGRFGPLSQAR